jgi:hypothetical protein
MLPLKEKWVVVFIWERAARETSATLLDSCKTMMSITVKIKN